MTVPSSCTIDIQIPVLSGADDPLDVSFDSTDTTTIISDVASPNGAWECVVQQTFEGGDPALSVVFKWVPGTTGQSDLDNQAKVYQFLAQFAQLQVVQDRNVVISVHLRRPAMLLCGVQVHMDPTMVRCGNQYDFSIQLISFTPGQQIHGKQYIAHPSGVYHPKSPHDSCGRRYHLDDYSADNPKAKLTTFLGRPEAADMRLSCLVKSTGNSSGPEDQYSVIPVHSCILKAADTAPARRLLRNNIATNSQNTHNIAEFFQNRLTQGSDLGLGRLLSRNSITPDICIPEHPPQSGVIKEIRFEDAVPQALEAVTHFMYTGQTPTPEPYSHYTVKDLMELAVYFDLQDLQDHCIALALGWGQPWSGAPVVYRQDMENQHAYASPCAELQQGDQSSNRGQEQQLPRQRQQALSLDPSLYGISSSISGGQGQQSQLSPESLLQTLFDWGHRFPRMRRALVQVLCRDHGQMLAHPGGVLARYREHAAYSEVLAEMVGEQARMLG